MHALSPADEIGDDQNYEAHGIPNLTKSQTLSVMSRYLGI